MRRSEPRPSRHPRRIALGLATATLVAGSAMVAVGLTPALLVAVVTVLLTLSLSRPFGWVQAIAMAPMALVALFMVLVQIYPDVDLPWALTNTVVLVLLGLGALVALARGGSLPPVSAEARRLSLAAAAVPALCAGWLAALWAFASSPKIAWMMGNDSAFNIFSSRWILLDGGVDPDAHPSPASGVSVLVALFMAPGRDAVSGSGLLEHDVERATQALILALCALSFIGAIAVALVVPRGHLVTRAAVAVFVSALPWSWFLFGYATHFGFWNALVSSALLAAAWLAFAEAWRHPTAASATQALAGTALLPLWAPLLLIPAAFALALLVRHWRAHVALRGAALVAWLTPVAVLGWYFLFVLRPLLTGQGGALAADGAVLSISRTDIVVVLVATAALGLLAHVVRGRSWELVGVALVLVSGLAGLEYLVAQRADAPTGPWGYYPAKFGWLVVGLALLMAARAALAVVLPATAPTDEESLGATEERTPPSRRARLGSVGGALTAALATVLLVSVLAAQVPPADPRLPTASNPTLRPTPVWDLDAVWPLVSISQADGASVLDEPVEMLFELSDPDEKYVLSHYHEDPVLDGIVNFWLLSQPVVEDNNDVRWYAYFLERDNPQSLCDLAVTWGPGLVVLTSEESWGATLESTCPDAGMEIRVEDPR